MTTIMMLTTFGFAAAVGVDPGSFAGYERIRSLLAGDQFEAFFQEADRLSEFAGRAAHRSEGPLKARFEAAAKSAARFKDAKDLPKARLVFGELSREFVEILRLDPNLAPGLTVYRCPMVKEGYALWIQTGKEISNPYMGKSMEQCGVPVEKD